MQSHHLRPSASDTPRHRTPDTEIDIHQLPIRPTGSYREVLGSGGADGHPAVANMPFVSERAVPADISARVPIEKREEWNRHHRHLLVPNGDDDLKWITVPTSQINPHSTRPNPYALAQCSDVIERVRARANNAHAA